MEFVRKDGEHARKRAALHVYDGLGAKIMIATSRDDAEKLLAKAVEAGGTIEIEISLDGQPIKGKVIEARMNTFNAKGEKVTGPGVLSLSNLDFK